MSECSAGSKIKKKNPFGTCATNLIFKVPRARVIDWTWGLWGRIVNQMHRIQKADPTLSSHGSKKGYSSDNNFMETLEISHTSSDAPVTTWDTIYKYWHECESHKHKKTAGSRAHRLKCLVTWLSLGNWGRGCLASFLLCSYKSKIRGCIISYPDNQVQCARIFMDQQSIHSSPRKILIY